MTENNSSSFPDLNDAISDLVVDAHLIALNVLEAGGPDDLRDNHDIVMHLMRRLEAAAAAVDNAREWAAEATRLNGGRPPLRLVS